MSKTHGANNHEQNSTSNDQESVLGKSELEGTYEENKSLQITRR